jgi:hypothetical protein
MTRLIICILAYSALLVVSGVVAWLYANNVVRGWWPIMVTTTLVWGGFAGFWYLVVQSAAVKAWIKPKNERSGPSERRRGK